MKILSVNELEVIKFLNTGTYSLVSLVKFDNKIYCYKFFRYPYSDNNIIDRIAKLTDINFPEKFLVPLYMVKDGFGISGYLSNYNENLLEINDCFMRDEQIKLLKSARNLSSFLHDELKYIHGDLHYGNLLCNKDNLSTYFLDFDFSMKIGDVPNIIDDYSELVQYYLQYYPFDKNVDIFLFNLSTLHILKNEYAWDDDLLYAIFNDSYEIPEMNNDVKRLSKELLLRDISKPYSGEYIIDYID